MSPHRILPFLLLCSTTTLHAQGFSQDLRFREVSRSVGIDAILENSIDHPAKTMNGSASVGDLDGDGLIDIFIPSTGVHPDRIYLGQVDGTFHLKFPTILGATSLYRGVGSTIGDFDKDGLLDIYVTSFGDMDGIPGPGANRLYHNNGDGSFTEVATLAGVAFDSPDLPDGFGCCFGDYDLDGDLDLFVCGWLASSNGNRLYRNEGDGTFVDQTIAAGIEIPFVRGFSPRFADLDGDRYPELMIAGDFGTSVLFQNLRDGSFLDITLSLQPDKVHFGMGQALGDFNGDGLLDWYVTSVYFDSQQQGIPNGNRLYLNRGRLQSALAVPFSSGINDGGWGWGAIAGDFDNDGDLDLAEVNGWEDAEWIGESSYLYLNDGDANFVESSQEVRFDDDGQCRGLVSFDYQNDGDLDLLVLIHDGPAHLYRNDLQSDNHWLRVDVDTSSNPALAPDGFGTLVRAELNGSGHIQYLDGGTSYLGCSQMTAHFGLADAQSVDRVVVEWADGFRSVIEDVTADQVLQVAAVEPLIQDAIIHRGTSFTSTLSGIRPGESAWFLGTLNGTTPFGPTFPVLGGMHINLRQPVFVLGVGIADEDGIATLQKNLAPWFPLLHLSTQAVVARDIYDRGSIKSNVEVRQILP